MAALDTAVPISARDQTSRLLAVDLLRGLVIVLMALDHTRDFFSNAHIDPVDLNVTTPALFFTRWITHFCAPVFIFLAGTAAALSVQRGKSVADTRSFLVQRGFFVILLGLSMESVVWTPRADFSVISGSVLWAIGCSMMILGLATVLPTLLITLMGLAIIALHNAFDGVRAGDLGVGGELWSILHTGEYVDVMPGLVFQPFYPLLPWIGVMAAGYGFGFAMLGPSRHRETRLICMGIMLTLLFCTLRYLQIYGDPRPWSPQVSTLFTLMSFLNCEKYPPSLLYLLMTLGPALIVLAWVERSPGWLQRWLSIFGRVPLFFYVIHLPFIIVLATLVQLLKTGVLVDFFARPFADPGYGYSLPFVYVAWLFVLFGLHPLCKWYANWKARHPHWQFLSYL